MNDFAKVVTNSAIKPIQKKSSMVIYAEFRVSWNAQLLVAETIKDDNGDGRVLEYGVAETPLGTCLLAQLGGYICHLAFIEPEAIEAELNRINQRWPLATISDNRINVTDALENLLDADKLPHTEVKIVLKGSRFQLAVWKQVLRIKPGEMVSYQMVADRLGRPDSVRAVGTAIGKNDIAVIVPCHRVVSGSGALGQYRWGAERKRVLLNNERSVFVK